MRGIKGLKNNCGVPLNINYRRQLDELRCSHYSTEQDRYCVGKMETTTLRSGQVHELRGVYNTNPQSVAEYQAGQKYGTLQYGGCLYSTKSGTYPYWTSVGNFECSMEKNGNLGPKRNVPEI